SRVILLAMLTLVLLTYSTTYEAFSVNNGLKQKTTVFEPYQFIIFGDTRNDASGVNTGLEIVSGLITDLLADVNLNIQFAVHTGDAVNEGPNQAEWDTYYWPNMAAINDSIPIYMAVGNHEIEASAPNPHDTELVTFKNNVNNPGNEVYFSFDSPQNDIHFIFLNAENFNYGDCWDKNATKLQAQMDWLDADLAANSIEQIVLVMHRPLWGVNPGREQDYEDFRAVFADEAIETGADLIINGHDHYGYYTYRNHSTGGAAGGAHILVNGGGTPFLNKPIPDYFNPEKNPTGPGTLLNYDFWYEGNEICLANVTENGIEIDMIGADGSVVFSFNTAETPTHIPWEIPTTTTTTTTTTTEESPTSAPGFELEIVITAFAGIVTLVSLRKKYRR
ncbi:MAG: metallophosphoesterase family protein, partial [Candidatus Hodarchaeales archaeon]